MPHCTFVCLARTRTYQKCGSMPAFDRKRPQRFATHCCAVEFLLCSLLVRSLSRGTKVWCDSNFCLWEATWQSPPCTFASLVLRHCRSVVQCQHLTEKDHRNLQLTIVQLNFLLCSLLVRSLSRGTKVWCDSNFCLWEATWQSPPCTFASLVLRHCRNVVQCQHLTEKDHRNLQLTIVQLNFLLCSLLVRSLSRGTKVWCDSNFCLWEATWQSPPCTFASLVLRHCRNVVQCQHLTEKDHRNLQLTIVQLNFLLCSLLVRSLSRGTKVWCDSNFCLWEATWQSPPCTFASLVLRHCRNVVQCQHLTEKDHRNLQPTNVQLNSCSAHFWFARSRAAQKCSGAPPLPMGSNLRVRVWARQCVSAMIWWCNSAQIFSVSHITKAQLLLQGSPSCTQLPLHLPHLLSRNSIGVAK